MNFLKKFHLKSDMAKSLFLIAIIFLIIYIVLIIFIERSESIDFLKNHGFWYYVFYGFTQISLLLFSVTATAVVSNWVIEVRRSNNTFTDIICNDFLASDTFYNALAPEKQKAILENLEKNFYFKGSCSIEDMYRSIGKKLVNIDSMYYESCTYDIECEITQEYIRKRITRTAEIKSCSGTKVLNSLPLASTTFKPSDNINQGNTSFISASINGKVINKNRIKQTKVDVTDTTSKKNGYSHTVKYFYDKGITITPTTPTKLKVEYETYSPKYDIAYVSRLRYPCKKFSFTFKLIGNNINEYELSSHSFGFSEEAEESGSIDSRTSINVKFNDWIFPSDGMAIAICKKD